MNKKLHTIILLLLSVSFSYATQGIKISGIVTDKHSNEPLMFVNIGIEGTFTGTSSNALGEFTLSIAESQMNDNVFFSAIGYQNLSLNVAELISGQALIVKMEPLTYGIEDIEITADSRVMYRIMRDASRAIPLHFITSAYSAKALYSSEVYIDRELESKREATVSLSDATGYGQKKNAYVARNYRFENVKRNFEVETLQQGTTLMDELLSIDILREPFNVSDTVYLSAYDLDMHEAEILNGDSVWVIAFRNMKPAMSHTGNYKPETYQGRLYISKENNVLLKAEIQTVAEHQSAVKPDIAFRSEKALSRVNNHYTVTYMHTRAGYVPEKLTLDRNYLNENGNEVRELASLLYIETNAHEPELLTHRQYFENLVSDPDFWLRFEE